MDYQTKPASRNDLRKFASILRRLFHVPNSGQFPVLDALEMLPDIFPGSNYVVVEDYKLPAKVMAQCSPNEAGGFTIEIKQSVYDGAYNNRIGAFLGFICHEICHIFLFEIGFKPIYARGFDNNELPAYCSVEWQAKALCAEAMIPFHESGNMSVSEIMDKYHVSKAFATNRRKLEKQERGGKLGR